jgi:hypothetical protein
MFVYYAHDEYFRVVKVKLERELVHFAPLRFLFFFSNGSLSFLEIKIKVIKTAILVTPEKYYPCVR